MQHYCSVIQVVKMYRIAHIILHVQNAAAYPKRDGKSETRGRSQFPSQEPCAVRKTSYDGEAGGVYMKLLVPVMFHRPRSPPFSGQADQAQSTQWGLPPTRRRSAVRDGNAAQSACARFKRGPITTTTERGSPPLTDCGMKKPP